MHTHTHTHTHTYTKHTTEEKRRQQKEQQQKKGKDARIDQQIKKKPDKSRVFCLLKLLLRCFL